MAVALKFSTCDSMLVKPKNKVFERQAVFLKNCKQTAENVDKFSEIEKKPTASQTHFAFTNIGSKMHSFRDTAGHLKSEILIWVTLYFSIFQMLSDDIQRYHSKPFHNLLHCQEKING